MDDCIFCRIVKGEIPCQKIYEDENTLAFLDIDPQTKGHILVIPKEHVSDIFEISEDQLCSVMSSVKKVSKKIEDVYDPKGIKIVQNNREIAGQTVFHFHVHVKPLYDIGQIPSEVLNRHKLSKEEMDQIQKDLAITD